MAETWARLVNGIVLRLREAEADRQMGDQHAVEGVYVDEQTLLARAWEIAIETIELGKEAEITQSYIKDTVGRSAGTGKHTSPDGKRRPLLRGKSI